MTEAAQDIVIDGVETEIDSHNVDYYTEYNKNQSSCDDHSESESKSDFFEEVSQTERCQTNQNDETDVVNSPLDSFDNHFNDSAFDETQFKSWSHFYDHYCQEAKKLHSKDFETFEENKTDDDTDIPQLRLNDLSDQLKNEIYSPLNELAKECVSDVIETSDSNNNNNNNIDDSNNQPVEDLNNDRHFFERVNHLKSNYLSETLYDSEVTCHFTKLRISLDANFDVYKNIMQKWLDGELDRESYETYIKEYVPKEALKYHNKLILTLLQKSFNLSQIFKEPQRYFDQIDINDFFNEFAKIRGQSDQSKSIESSAALKSSNKPKDESHDDDDDDIVIKKNKKRKRKLFQILDDDDDDDTIPQSTNATLTSKTSVTSETFTPTKKKKRKMVITSDDENEGESPSVYDTESSNLNVLNLENENDTKVIDIKSTGTLKTTLTISRKSLLDSPATKPSNVKSSSSLLDRLLSSETPISLLPNSDVNSQPSTSSSKVSPNDKKVFRIQNSTLLKPVSSGDLKITKAGSSKTTPQSQKIVTTLNPSNLRISTTIAKPSVSKQSSSLIQSTSRKVENKKLKSALLNSTTKSTVTSTVISNSSPSNSGALVDSDTKSAARPVTSQTAPLLVKKLNEGKTTSSTVNSKLIELLNRKSSNALDNQNATSSQQQTKLSPLKTLLSSSNDTSDGQINCEKLLEEINRDTNPKTRPNSKKSAGKKHKKSESANSTSGDLFSDTSSQQSLVSSVVFSTNENLGTIPNVASAHTVIENCQQQPGFFIDYNVDSQKRDESNVHDDSNEIDVKSCAEQEMSMCVKELSLPDHNQLVIRISNYASHYQLTTFDNKIVPLCQVALKNFMKNILSQLLISRSAFRTSDDRIRHHIGVPVGNPYLNTFHRPFQMGPNPNGLMFSSGCDSLARLAHHECQLLPTSYLDSYIEPRKCSVKRRELSFSARDQVTIDPNQDGVVCKFRPNSGILHIPEESPRMTLRTNLHHLYSVLSSDRSLIPVNRVLSRALNETIASLNNVSEIHSEGNS